MDAFIGGGLPAELFHPVGDLHCFCFGDGVFSGRVFDFTEVDNIVGAEDYKVDLGSRVGLCAAPGTVLGKYPVQMQGLEYLGDMRHGHALEGQTEPVVLSRCVDGVCPIVGIADLFCGEGKVW